MDGISVKGLSLRYGDRLIFENVGFELCRGEKGVLIGESGRGKSSLMMALLGFVVPCGGEIMVGGMLMNEINMLRIRRLMAWVPQEFALPFETVGRWRDALFGLAANRSVFPKDGVVKALFDVLGLGDVGMDKPVAELSGGERQRVMIAFAVLLKKPFLLMDEPTSALDRGSADRVVDLLRSLSTTTVLTVSHDDYFIGGFERVISI